MKKLSLSILSAALVALPGGVAGQALGVAARAGTLGIGAEGALGLGGTLVARGGVGLIPVEVNATISDIDATLKLPKSWYNLGLDVYLTGAMRIGGGMLFKPDDVTLVGNLNGPTDIGGQTYTPSEIGTLTGTMDSGVRAPYVLLGFGKHTATGIGLSVDVGAAFLRDPTITLVSEGGTLSGTPEMQSRLAQEAMRFQDDLPAYMNIWPILNLGLRIGLGG